MIDWVPSLQLKNIEEAGDAYRTLGMGAGILYCLLVYYYHTFFNLRSLSLLLYLQSTLLLLFLDTKP